MTDEEKAIKDLCIKCGSYDFCVKENQLHCAETVAYIKGLAEGRKEKWHDMRKDPNDLPKERGGYLILHEDNAGFTHYCVRDFRHGYFECTNTIIAWCELPKFEE